MNAATVHAHCKSDDTPLQDQTLNFQNCQNSTQIRQITDKMFQGGSPLPEDEHEDLDMENLHDDEPISLKLDQLNLNEKENRLDKSVLSSKISFYHALQKTSHRHASSPPQLVSAGDTAQRRDCYFWGANRQTCFINKSSKVVRKATRMKSL
jgi:hypothetical protein